MIKRTIVIVVAFLAVAAKDATPRACVDCHNKDMKLSAMLAKSAPKIVAKVQPLTAKKLIGKHPPIGAAAKDIPAKCVPCHKDGKVGPVLAPMVHVIHLTGNDAFKGDCTSCHKLDAAKGTMSIPSAPEP